MNSFLTVMNKLSYVLLCEHFKKNIYSGNAIPKKDKHSRYIYNNV